MSIRNRLRDESGVTLVVVMGALLVLTLFSLALANEATQQSGNAVSDRGAKRALAAASSGLSLARYRLNTTPPAAANCMASGPGPSWEFAPSGINCPAPASGAPATEALGNGAAFKYLVSPVLSAGATCGAAQTIPTGARCATAIGTASGQQRRIQTLFARERAFVLFGSAGVTAQNAISASNATSIGTDVGANGSVTVTNSANVAGKAYLPASAPATALTTNTGGTVTGGRANIPAPGTFQFPLPDIDSSAVAPPATIYNAGTKSIALGGTQIATIPAGIYVVCGISLGNSAQLMLPASGAVQIYVDSPLRSGSSCPVGSGKVNLAQGSKFNAQAGYDASKLDLFIYGTTTNGAATDFDLGNAATFNGTVYAPQSTVLIENAGRIDGAIAGYNVTFQNTGNLTFPAGLRTKQYPLPGRYEVTGWTECRPTPSNPSDISSGC